MRERDHSPAATSNAVWARLFTEDMFSARISSHSLDRQLDTFPTWEYANGIPGFWDILEVITGTDFETYARRISFNLWA